MREIAKIKADLHCDADCDNCPDAGSVPCARVYRTIQDVPELVDRVEQLRALVQDLEARLEGIPDEAGGLWTWTADV